MGYSTCGMHGRGSKGPRTCDNCDRCPKCDGFRMTIKRCPFNYCAPDYLCPRCVPKWRACDCRANPNPIQSVALELATTADDHPIADVPFSLTATIARGGGKQGGLF